MTLEIVKLKWCSLFMALLTMTIPGLAQPSSGLKYYAPPEGQPPDPLSAEDGSIINSLTSAKVQLKAAVWGEPTSDTFTDFISISHTEAVGNSSISGCLVTATYQLRRQGFNAIFLPVSPRDLRATASCNETAHKCCMQVPLDRFSATPTPGDTAAGTTVSWPCSGLLPNTTTLDRLLWSVQWFVVNGLYVILTGPERHSFYDAAGASDNTAEHNATVKAFAASWTRLWQAVVSMPAFDSAIQGRVMLQPLAASAAAGLRWESYTTTSGATQPGLQEVYLHTLDAVEAVSPGAAVYILHGPLQQGLHSAGTDSWDDGFAASPALLKLGVSDPTPMFAALLQKTYRSKVMLSPRVHATLQRCTHATAVGASSMAAGCTSQAGATPLKLLDNRFHQLVSRGFCVSEDNCLNFPVAVLQVPEQRHSSAQNDKSADFVQQFAEYVLRQQTVSKTRAAAGDLGDDYTPVGNWLLWDLDGQGKAPTDEVDQQQGQHVIPPIDADVGAPFASSQHQHKHFSNSSSTEEGRSPNSIMTFIYTDGESTDDLHIDIHSGN